MARSPLLLLPTPTVSTGQQGSGESFSLVDVINLPAPIANEIPDFVDPSSALIYPLWYTVPGAPPAVQPNATTQTVDTYQDRADFYKWMNARGVRLGSYYVGGDLSGAKVWNAYEKTATGAWRSVGKNWIVPEIFDSVFWAVAKLAASIVTAGGSDVIVAAGEASVNDNSAAYQNAAVSIAKSYVGASDSGASTTAVSTASEVSTVDDFWGDGFNFSSGEPDFQFSDAQTVSYGFDTDVGSFDPLVQNPVDDYWSGGAYDFGAGSGDYNFGGTPEVTTNDFGTIFDNKTWGEESLKSATKALPVAVAVANQASKPGTGAVASGGGSGAKSAGSNDVLAGLSNLFGAVKTAAAGVNQQKTTAANPSYTGQLTPSGGAGGSLIGGVSNSMLLIVGGLVLVGGAIYLHGKG